MLQVWRAFVFFYEPGKFGDLARAYVRNFPELLISITGAIIPYFPATNSVTCLFKSLDKNYSNKNNNFAFFYFVCVLLLTMSGKCNVTKLRPARKYSIFISAFFRGLFINWLRRFCVSGENTAGKNVISTKVDPGPRGDCIYVHMYENMCAQIKGIFVREHFLMFDSERIYF